MKKIFLFLVIIIFVIMVGTQKFKTEKNVSFKNSNNSLSIMLQNENGEYQEGDNSFNQEGYHFNSKRSKCLMGSKIKYDDSDKSLSINTTKSDRCYAYFDNNNFVEDLSGNGNNGNVPSSANWTNEGIAINDSTVNSILTPNQLGDNFSMVVRFKINKQFELNSTFQYWLISGFNYGISFYLRYSTITMNPYFQTYYGPQLHDFASGNNINTNEFYTIVGTYDYNNKMIVFYNKGIKEAQSIITDKRNEITFNFILNEGFTFSDVLIFDRVLTEEEIAQDYANKINPTNKEDLLLWYKFN